MDANELVGMLERGDLYGLMLRVNRIWLDRDHPGSKYGCVTAQLGEGVPDLVVPIIQGCPSASPTLPAS